jgi:hypothetical protein
MTKTRSEKIYCDWSGSISNFLNNPRHESYLPAPVITLITYNSNYVPLDSNDVQSWEFVCGNSVVADSSSNSNFVREPRYLSRYSDWLRVGRPRGPSSRPGRVKDVLFLTMSWPALGFSQPPFKWALGVLSPGIKRQGREPHHSNPANAEIKKTWSVYPLSHTSSWRSS